MIKILPVNTYHVDEDTPPTERSWYKNRQSRSHKIYTRCCCASFCPGYIILLNEFMWLIYPHYDAVMMGVMASQITSLTIVYSTVSSGANQRKHQSSASLAFVRGIHWWPVNSPHKWPVTRKYFHLMTSSCMYMYFRVPSMASGHSYAGYR